jgi:hypothetical protein
MHPVGGSAPARISPAEGICRELEQAFHDPTMVDEGDTPPSREALDRAKRMLEETQELLKAPKTMSHPDIEFFDGSIRLVWRWADANVLLVIASTSERPSYVYHADIRNGSVADYCEAAPTSSNLAHWLTVHS